MTANARAIGANALPKSEIVRPMNNRRNSRSTNGPNGRPASSGISRLPALIVPRSTVTRAGGTRLPRSGYEGSPLSESADTCGGLAARAVEVVDLSVDPGQLEAIAVCV